MYRVHALEVVQARHVLATATFSGKELRFDMLVLAVDAQHPAHDARVLGAVAPVTDHAQLLIAVPEGLGEYSSHYPAEVLHRHRLERSAAVRHAKYIATVMASPWQAAGEEV